jgi:hypothetical protein
MIVKFRTDRNQDGWTFIGDVQNVLKPRNPGPAYTLQGFGDYIFNLMSDHEAVYIAVTGWLDSPEGEPPTNSFVVRTFVCQTPLGEIAVVSNQEVYLLSDDGKTIESLHR